MDIFERAGPLQSRCRHDACTRPGRIDGPRAAAAIRNLSDAALAAGLPVE